MSNYRERYFAWWELKAIIERELPQRQVDALLSDIGPALYAYLEPPPPPKMAFDEVPEPAIIKLVADLLSRLLNGDYDRHAIEKVRRWTTKMLRDVDCNIAPGTPSYNAVVAFMQRRVETWPDDLPAPTEADDAVELRRKFGLTRSEARIVRIEATPDEWRRQGPRQPWGKRAR